MAGGPIRNEVMAYMRTMEFSKALDVIQRNKVGGQFTAKGVMYTITEVNNPAVKDGSTRKAVGTAIRYSNRFTTEDQQKWEQLTHRDFNGAFNKEDTVLVPNDAPQLIAGTLSSIPKEIADYHEILERDIQHLESRQQQARAKENPTMATTKERTQATEEVQPKRENSYTLINKANNRLSEALKTPEGLEKLVNSMGYRLHEGKVNSLLTYDTVNTASQEYYQKHGLEQDLSGLKGISIITPKLDKKGYVVKNAKGFPEFTVGKVYSAQEIAKEFPEVAKQAFAIAQQREHRVPGTWDQRRDATYNVFKKMNIIDPKWVNDSWKKRPSADQMLQTKMTRKMALAYAGVNNTAFKLSPDDRETLAAMEPEAVEKMFTKSSNLARKVGREIDRELYHELNHNQNREQAPNAPEKERGKQPVAPTKQQSKMPTPAAPAPAKPKGRAR